MSDKEKLEAKFNRLSISKGKYSYLEINGNTNKEGLLYKYVYVFNEFGDDITKSIATFLNKKTSKSKIYYQAIYTTGYGFQLMDYISDELKNKQTNNK